LAFEIENKVRTSLGIPLLAVTDDGTPVAKPGKAAKAAKDKELAE
jgi:hypothetical protein